MGLERRKDSPSMWRFKDTVEAFERTGTAVSTSLQALQAELASLKESLLHPPIPPDYLPASSSSAFPPVTHPTPADAQPARPQPETTLLDSRDKEKQKTTTVSGNVGRIIVRTSPRTKQPILDIPLALHDEPGKTEWIHVLFFGQEKVERYCKRFVEGQRIDAVGYEHQREVRLKDGMVRIVRDIYAAVARPHEE